MRAALRIESTNSLFIQRQTHTYLGYPSLLTAQSDLKCTSTIFPPIKPYIFLKVIKEMDGFDWDNTNAVIGELIPLPACLQSNFSGEFDNSSECYAHIYKDFGIEESLPHAILDLHKLKPSNKNLKIDEVTSSSATGWDTDSIDSKPLSEHQESKLVMINENTLSPQSCQANIINPSPKQTHIFLECTRNPNVHKRCRNNTSDCPKQSFIAPNPSRRSKRFEIVFENTCRIKRPKIQSSVNLANISFSNKSLSGWELDEEAMAEVKEIVYMQAAMQPVNLALEEVTEKPKRKNVRISSDPQTVAARNRREKISERLRVLQRLVPGGSKLDTASMLDEAASYVKFLQSLVRGLENLDPTVCSMISAIANPIETTLPLPQTKP